MTTPINDGGPAFPVPLNPGEPWQGMAPCDGMTLRDYFAARAMQASWSGHVSHYGHDQNFWQPKDVAEHAYEMADAMLKARSALAQEQGGSDAPAT